MPNLIMMQVNNDSGTTDINAHALLRTEMNQKHRKNMVGLDVQVLTCKPTLHAFLNSPAHITR